MRRRNVWAVTWARKAQHADEQRIGTSKVRVVAPSAPDWDETVRLGLFEHGPALHHELHLPDRRDVFRGVTLDGDEVGE
jgi:hypothetical protein